jgi:negative regulator of flagellin synthesis FlgM
MKVSNQNANSPSAVNGSATQKVDGKNKKSSAGASAQNENIGSSARVDVSERAQQMQKAKDVAMAADSIDEAKVARLQRLIDDGKYKVDSDAVADRLVDTHMAFPD